MIKFYVKLHFYWNLPDLHQHQRARIREPVVFKQIQHLPEKRSDHFDWIRSFRINNPIDKGDQRIYYRDTYNINLFDYKVRRRFNVNSIPQYQYGYHRAMELYQKFNQTPKMIETIPGKATSHYEVSKKDKLLINDPDLFFRRTPPPETDSNTTMSEISYVSATDWPATVNAPPTPRND
ncbi:hypothetical protein RhiirA4_462519 [Rhizophagus irregularis]|uniref:Uncharacterized protein n=1 Tax=Rhizophagus irregularis TaxID=588596 RepID=A0A2I1GL69_9GLOM|nr:hypothetical protein RhiirA4_462519 [Rhizophagus irregularis]